MGREVRRVPADWQHPKNASGHYIPMHEHFPYNAEEVAEGLREEWLTGDAPNYNIGVMPQWTDEQRTHLQMYEDTSEGTPISPVMENPEVLAKWLVDNKASAFGDMTATYEQWLTTARRGFAPSMVIQNGVVQSGVAWTKTEEKPTTRREPSKAEWAIWADYNSAMREARDCVFWLTAQIKEADANGLDGAFTPGNMASTVGKLEAARWKAKACKEALVNLGIFDTLLALVGGKNSSSEAVEAS